MAPFYKKGIFDTVIYMNYKDVVNFFFEVGILARTPRSGFHFLGSGQQSVAEHNNRVVFIGYALASLDGSCDTLKVLKMCLWHDITEARISDLNYVHQKYTDRKEYQAIEDLTSLLSFGDDVRDVITEYEELESRESHLAHDADQLEWILSLKEQLDVGNSRAEQFFPPSLKRLSTALARDLAKAIINTDSQEWWFGDREDSWWVHGGKNTHKKKG